MRMQGERRRAPARGARLGGTAALAVAFAWLALGGCASAQVESEPTAGGTRGTTVEVGLREYRIDMPRDIRAGEVTFRVHNAGTEEHNFEIEGMGIERAFPTNLMPGETQTMTLQLVAGSYEVYCPVASHADRGMRLRLDVTD